ncbi:RGS domain-containing protein [Gongronella butleri]|nr:RGS domain-containing protein [Gongronella butleri]
MTSPPSPVLTPTTLPKTLEELLQQVDSPCFQHFQAYLERSFCCENLYFWLDVQEYNDLCGRLPSDFAFLRGHEARLDANEQLIFHVVQQKCQAMLDTYVRSSSSQEINIPCDLRQDLIAHVERGQFHPSIFIKLTKCVVELMRVNAFIPWISASNASPMSPQSPPTATDMAPSLSTSSSQSSPTSFTFPAALDRLYTFGKLKSNPQTQQQGQRASMPPLEAPQCLQDLLQEPASTRYRAMLQRVKVSLQPNAIKSSWKRSM